MPKLTKIVVEAAEPGPKQISIWCSELRGFGCWIQPSGRRTYFVDYRNAEGTRRRLKIGDHGPMTADKARKEALKYLGKVVTGEDPADEKAKIRKGLTVRGLCDIYLQACEKELVLTRKGKPKKASTLKTDRGRIDRHILPLLGSKLVAKLTGPDISQFVTDVTVGKTATVVKTGLRGKAVVTGGAGTAARTHGLLSGMLTFAVQRGLIDKNPALGVPHRADEKRDRILTEDEYHRLGRILWRSSLAKGVPPRAVEGIYILALTGMRFSEVRTLRWENINEQKSYFYLPKTKTGPSTRVVGPEVFEALAMFGKHDAFGWVLPGVRQDGPYGGFRAAWNKVAKIAGLEGVTPHTLRHSFASIGNDVGLTTATIGALMGHSPVGQTGSYIHHVDQALVVAATKIGERIFHLLFDAEMEEYGRKFVEERAAAERDAREINWANMRPSA